MTDNNYEYAGFWSRTAATLLDTILLLMITWPILYAIYGERYFGETFEYTAIQVIIEWVFPIVATIIFWVTKSATPGKMALSLKVLDEHTGDTLTVGQSIGRYFGYFVSMLPLGLGLLWVAWDSKKQAFHDKLASTVVVKDKRGNIQPVRFE